MLERAAILATDGHPLGADDLPPEFQLDPPGTSTLLLTDPANRSLRAMEARHIRHVLTDAGGNKTEAARQLGIGLTTLYRKVQEYGITE